MEITTDRATRTMSSSTRIVKMKTLTLNENQDHINLTNTSSYKTKDPAKEVETKQNGKTNESVNGNGNEHEKGNGNQRTSDTNDSST